RQPRRYPHRPPAARSAAVADLDRGADRARRRRRLSAARPQLRSLARLDLLAHEAPMKTLCLPLASLLSALGALAACGDNHQNLPDAGSTIVPGPSSRAVVVVGDFTPGDFGVLSTVDTATRTARMNVGPTGAVGSDPVLRHIGRELLIINRGENNV